MKNQIRLFVLACAIFATNAAHAVSPASFQAEILTQAKSVVWGFDFLPDGRILLTEREGRLLIFEPTTKNLTEVSGTPKVFTKGQGGLLDVRVHPRFAKNKKVLFSFSEVVGDDATTAVGVAQLDGQGLVDFKKIFSAVPANSNNIHFGSRIEFDKAGHILFTVGDRNDRHLAQDKSVHLGKVLRLNDDGSVPKDNPFLSDPKARPEIFSLGHRNPQGLVFDAKINTLWSTEFGPRGGDELNRILAGKNYGWPIITFGREYWGPKIGDGTSKVGFEDPVSHWVPSISPSAVTIYTGKVFPEWTGDLFLANLSGTHIRRLKMKDGKVLEQEEILKGYGRFRNLRTGPDGLLYFSMDDGRLGRLGRN